MKRNVGRSSCRSQGGCQKSDTARSALKLENLRGLAERAAERVSVSLVSFVSLQRSCVKQEET
jgi:hypothetical protein